MMKNTINYIINAVLAALMLDIAFIGILLGFVIPKGERAGYEVKLLLGLHRHDWGDLHMVLSLALLVLIVVHVWLHWSWVVACTQRLLCRTTWGIVAVVIVAAAVIFVVAWQASPRAYARKDKGAGQRIEDGQPRRGQGEGRRGQ
ncbi:MAG: DUF4405 domain-containing protein [Verrucomicrobia bacterium]|nr:DUF4405 domain-containing protein [Verrucomicrobiota bacterium]